jgi:hypothetical protein
VPSAPSEEAIRKQSLQRNSTYERTAKIGCLVNNQTRYIVLVRTRPNSVITISYLFTFIFQNWENVPQPSEILRIFLKAGTGKVTIDVKQKHPAVIEFLLLEGCEDDDVVLRLQNA